MIDFAKQRLLPKNKYLESRREELTYWIDMYRDNQLDYLKDRIQEVYENPLNRKLLTARAEFVRLTKSVIDKISIIFQSGISISIADNPDATIELEKMLFQSKFKEILTTLNIYTNLLHDSHVIPRIDPATYLPVWDIILPNITIVWQNKEFPTQADRIAYIIDEYMDSPVSNTVNRVRVWEKDRTYTADFHNNGDLDNIEDEEPNYYGAIPLVHFIDEHRINEYFSSAGQIVITRNMSLNISYTELLCAISYQALSTLVFSGESDIDIPMGMANHIFLPTKGDYSQSVNADAKYINPGVNLEVIQKVISEAMAETALEYGINAEVFRSTAQASSGYQVKLNKQDIIKQNVEEIPLYEARLRELIQLAMKAQNHYAAPETTQSITKARLKWTEDDIDNVIVKIREPQFDESDEVVVQIDSMKLATGTTSPIRIIMRDENLNEEDATARYLQYQKERSMTGQANINPTNLEA